jgi:hypothetical protein
VVRNYRVYDPSYNVASAAEGTGRHIIEAWYDVEIMPRLKHNRHTKAASAQP